MPYPVVSEDAGRNWYRCWQEICQDAGRRIAPPEFPKTEQKPLGDEFDWESECEAIVQGLLHVLETDGEKAFEAKGAVMLHRALPDHGALRDPEFWYWLAIVPGSSLIAKRYPLKDKPLSSLEDGLDSEPAEKKPNFLPGRSNFVGQNAREVLFFRLWIRAEMARIVEAPDVASDPYEFAIRGSVEFWRSHLLRVLYAQHRAFLQAFVNFQFPSSACGAPRLTIPEIRQLAKDLAKACANVTVEMLNREQSSAFIERVWAKTSAAQAWVKS